MIEHQVAMAIHHLTMMTHYHPPTKIGREIDGALVWLREGQDVMNADRIAKGIAKEKEKSMSDSLQEKRTLCGEYDGEENANV